MVFYFPLKINLKPRQIFKNLDTNPTDKMFELLKFAWIFFTRQQQVLICINTIMSIVAQRCIIKKYKKAWKSRSKLFECYFLVGML